jgi:hypothetical protein
LLRSEHRIGVLLNVEQERRSNNERAGDAEFRGREDTGRERGTGMRITNDRVCEPLPQFLMERNGAHTVRT